MRATGDRERLTYRVDILGAGNISPTHAAPARATPEVEVVAIRGYSGARGAAIAG